MKIKTLEATLIIGGSGSTKIKAEPGLVRAASWFMDRCFSVFSRGLNNSPRLFPHILPSTLEFRT